MIRTAYFLLGILSLTLGAVGVILPLLPTVPFVLLAAFCFARSSPRLERWLTEHRTFGPHLLAWRTRRAISRKGKRAALLCFSASAILGLVLLAPPWSFAPLAVALIGGFWIATRAEA